MRTPSMTVSTLMRELIVLLFNTAVAVVVFVAGAATHQALGLGPWFAPLSLIPCLLWFWWRGAVSRKELPKMLLMTGACSIYVAFQG